MNFPQTARRRWPGWIALAGAALGLLYILLLIPDREATPPAGGGHAPFAWDRDALWESLEASFAMRRTSGCAAFNTEIDAAIIDLGTQIEAVATRAMAADDAALDRLEHSFFLAAPAFGACPARVPEFIGLYERMRSAVKMQSRTWPAEQSASRDRLYRLLYGGRAAIEELLLQMESESAPSLSLGTNEPCAGPATEVRGVRICSGDLLVSRAGAPTSALIARGNDYPGNFSHVALAHVGEDGTVSLIEAHLDRGVAVATLDQYFADKKLRIVVLRLRADHPALARNRSLAHRAASAALAEVRARHVPYDFEMDYQDHTKRFCSEVASAAYESQGVRLWQGLSSMSTPGVVGWLGALGVQHFVTEAPADLEYDPQLVVVAEWRDPATLAQDHIDNAVVDAMLAEADRGQRIEIARTSLPLVRLAKMWSATLNLLGAVGPVPEGMTATVALRAQAFRGRHAAIVQAMQPRVAQFRAEHGYAPPYWRLVELAREAASKTAW